MTCGVSDEEEEEEEEEEEKKRKEGLCNSLGVLERIISTVHCHIT